MSRWTCANSSGARVTQAPSPGKVRVVASAPPRVAQYFVRSVQLAHCPAGAAFGIVVRMMTASQYAVGRLDDLPRRLGMYLQ